MLGERYASRVIPENEVVAAPTRISDARDADRDADESTTRSGSDPSNATAIPTSGASSHSSPSAVSPSSTGKAERPMLR